MARKASWATLPALVVANEDSLAQEGFMDKPENPETFLWMLALSVGLFVEQVNACRQM